MPSINFNARLVFDYSFYSDVLKKENPDLMYKLMYINARARGNKRTFNILPKFIFDKILIDFSFERPLLRCSFYDFFKEEIEQLDDEMEKVIKYAIHILEEEPNNSFILTSDSNLEAYKANSHYQNVKEVSVKGTSESIAIIEDYFNQCKRQD
jgi:hypothetical protein